MADTLVRFVHQFNTMPPTLRDVKLSAPTYINEVIDRYSNETKEIDLHNGTQEIHDTARKIQKTDILRIIYEITKTEKLDNGRELTGNVTNFFHPKELENKLDLEYNEFGISSEDEIENIVTKIVEYSVKTQHRHFHNQLYGGIDEIGLASAWLMEALNTNPYTYEVAPVFVIIERYIVEKLIAIFGWDKGDGIFSPGGSIANMYGITVARQKKYPNLKQTGLFGQKPMALITSDMSHYSINKGSAFLGYGTEQVYSVKTNEKGQMTADSLRATIKKIKVDGKDPMFVNATAGTTVLGAFDPIDEIADVCKEEGIWLHVDACWGGAMIFSKKHKTLLKGIEKADSISWNPHKMMCVPLQCSVFLTRHKGLLADANKYGATYLFQKDKFYDVSYDTGDKSIQCGRKGDALKLWFTLKIKGLKEIENSIDNALEMARYFESCVRQRDHFELVIPNHVNTNICFWYLPTSMLYKERNSTWWDNLHKVAPAIKSKYLVGGTIQVGYQPIESKNLVNFFRMVVTSSPKATKQDMDFVLDEIERIGSELHY